MEAIQTKEHVRYGKELRQGGEKKVLQIIDVIFQNKPQCFQYTRWSTGNTHATGRILEHLQLYTSQ